MDTELKFCCPFCGDKLMPSEKINGAVKFICVSDECMATIEFSPIMIGKQLPREEAFKRIQKRTV